MWISLHRRADVLASIEAQDGRWIIIKSWLSSFVHVNLNTAVITAEETRTKYEGLESEIPNSTLLSYIDNIIL